MQVKSFFDGGFAAVSYLAYDENAMEGVIVDPAVSYISVASAVHPMPRVTAILLTHGHFDHMLTLAEWKERTGAPILIAQEDAPALTDATLNCNRMFFGTDEIYPPADRLLGEGDRITFGGETLIVMKTPGHTPGSCIYVGDGVIFTGDTIMADSAFGRYDLPGGSAQHLFNSLTRIAHMEGDYVLYPGHGRSTTLREEKNYYIR